MSVQHAVFSVDAKHTVVDREMGTSCCDLCLSQAYVPRAGMILLHLNADVSKCSWLNLKSRLIYSLYTYSPCF